jgi:hypothetical protein
LNFQPQAPATDQQLLLTHTREHIAAVAQHTQRVHQHTGADVSGTDFRMHQGNKFGVFAGEAHDDETYYNQHSVCNFVVFTPFSLFYRVAGEPCEERVYLFALNDVSFGFVFPQFKKGPWFNVPRLQHVSHSLKHAHRIWQPVWRAAD